MTVAAAVVASSVKAGGSDQPARVAGEHARYDDKYGKVNNPHQV